LPARSSSLRKSGKINLNTASAQELSDGLNGIGKVLAKRIVDYREKNGPFRSIEEVKNVSGIGNKIFEQIRDSITVS
jgi:competence protein ComEA